jgi:hypothetical protein
MNEAEWGQAADPSLMVLFLGEKATPGELALFAAACCERIRPLLADPRSFRALEVLNRHADGGEERELIANAIRQADRAVGQTIRAVCVPILGEAEFERQARQARTGPDPFEMMAHHDPAFNAAQAAAFALQCLTIPGYPDLASQYAAEAVARSSGTAAARENEKRVQADLLRDIIGNPFRPVTLDPAWLSPSVLTLAQAASDERLMPAGELCPSRLRILSDALEEAGCAEAAVLEHLRGPSPHARGCWVLRLLLAKE